MRGKLGQVKAVREYLESGHSLTSKEAFEMFGATRLSAIIYDLRRDGLAISTIKATGVTRFGTQCSFAIYKL